MTQHDKLRLAAVCSVQHNPNDDVEGHLSPRHRTSYTCKEGGEVLEALKCLPRLENRQADYSTHAFAH
jgi:hypothetical protein